MWCICRLAEGIYDTVNHKILLRKLEYYRIWGACSDWLKSFCKIVNNFYQSMDFNIHQKDWLTNSGGTDWPGELCYNFCISNDPTQMVNFPTWIPDCGSYSPALLDLFHLMLVFLFYNGFHSIGKFWSYCCLGFHWLSIKFTMRCPILLHCLWLLSCWLEWSLWLFERSSMGWFELGASTDASEFSEWVQVEIDVYITHRKYQGQASLISMIFSCLCCCHSS